MSRRTTWLPVVLAASAALVTPLAPLAAPNAVAAQTAPGACPLAVIKTVQAGVGGYAGAVNYNQASGVIYVAGQGGVEAVNGRTYQRTAVITTGQSPNGIAINPGTDTIYVANTGSGTLSVINGSTNKVTATIRIAPYPYNVAVDRRNGRVYVIGIYGEVWIVKARANKVIGTIDLRDYINGVALNQVSGLLYASNDSGPGNPGVIYVINVNTRRIVAKIHTAGDSRPDGVAVNPRTNTVYVSDDRNPEGDGVFVIKGATNHVTTRIPTAFGPGDIALNPGNNLVYVLSPGAENGAVMEIDGRDNKLINTLQLYNTFDVGFIGVNVPSRYIYVTEGIGDLLVLSGCR